MGLCLGQNSANLAQMGPKRVDFDLNLIRVFEAILRTRSVTAAAAELACGQPAISHALSRLRDVFKDPLFRRSRSGMVATPVAEELAKSFGRATQLIERSLDRKDEFDFARAEQEFNIMMSDISAVALLPEFVSYIRRAAPGISLNIKELSSQDTRAHLQSGRIHLAIGYLPTLKGGFHQQNIQSEQFVCMMRADHPAAGAPLSVAELRRFPHGLVTTRGTDYNIEMVFEKAKLKSVVMLNIAHYLAVPMIVSSTDLIVTIPSQLGTIFGEARNLSLSRHPLKLPHFTVCQYWHARYDRDPENRWLRRTVAQLFAGRDCNGGD